MGCVMSKLGLICRAAVLVAAAIVVAAPGAAAQTLTDPNPKPRWRPPSHAEKNHAPAAAKACEAYGAGFMQVPGTGACVKIGGFVEGTVSGGH